MLCFAFVLSDPVALEENAGWVLPDADYTPYSNRLSAVWADLRYNTYTYAVIEDSGSFGNLDTGLQNPCNHEGLVGECHTTEDNFINVYDLALTHGQLYRICINASATVLNREGWKDNLEEFKECTDGVVVDTTPPEPGTVWIGYGTGSRYQVSHVAKIQM